MIVRKFNFSILSTIYANLTRVVNKRKASLLGLDVGSHPLLDSLPAAPSSTEQFIVIFQDCELQQRLL